MNKELREAALRNEPQIESSIKQIRESKLLANDGAMAIVFKAQCKVILEYGKAIEQFDEAIKAHEDSKLFTPLPGAGAALAPRIPTAFSSDRERYENAEEVAALSGIAPVTKQSGKSCVVIQHRACSKFLRKTFHEFADHARVWSPSSKAYYQMQRARGMKHHAALRKLAHRWI